MATLSQMCELPNGWLALSAEREQKREIGMSKKLAWKMAKREERERMAAYRKREEKRAMRSGSVGCTMGSYRREVNRQTIAASIGLENRGEIFATAKGQSMRKRVKNTASKEEAGTIGNVVLVKRFPNSKITCTCKCRRF